MTRINAVPAENMSDEQRRMFDRVSARFGRVRGPFEVMVHAPEVGELVTGMVEHFMADTRIPKKLKELAIITVARQYTAQYEWFVHAPHAIKAGIDEAVVEAIRLRRRPDFTDPEEELVHDMANEIVEHRVLGDDNYARAVAALGEDAVVELVVLIGFYHAISVLLVSYQVDIPEGGAKPLPE